MVERRAQNRGITRRSLTAGAGLMICAFGISLQLGADIGVSPWETLNIGVSLRTGMSYGMVCVLISFLIVGLDVLLREPIGVGTLLDAFLVGWGVDLFCDHGLVPTPSSGFAKVLLLLVGMGVVCVGQCVYMRVGLCCGPRDSLLVGLARRSEYFPIGAVNVVLVAAVLAAGVLLGAPIGIGTVIAAFGTGPLLQLTCRTLRFDPKAVEHEGFRKMINQ